MGIFNPDRRPRPYVPPRGGPGGVTLLGDPSPRAPNTDGLPAPTQGTWRIELRYMPIGHRGHAFLTLVDPEGRTKGELHGLAQSRNTGEVVPFGADGSKLVAQAPPDRTPMWQRSSKVADVAHGPYDEIVRGTWASGLRASDEINQRDFDYKSHDPSYELGGDGGQIQNSNSAAYTLGRVMGLDLDRAVHDAGMGRRFSGWNRDLLGPDYQRYVAPPTLPVAQAP